MTVQLSYSARRTKIDDAQAIHVEKDIDELDELGELGELRIQDQPSE
jgi:hypothetical protein